jgi:hypothetical protein
MLAEEELRHHAQIDLLTGLEAGTNETMRERYLGKQASQIAEALHLSRGNYGDIARQIPVKPLIY